MLQKKEYFNYLSNIQKDYFYLRRHRQLIKGLTNSFLFNAGDIVKVIYFRKNYSYVFEGICLGIKKKSFLTPNTSFKLRNIILGIGIEMIFLFFSKRLYFLKLHDYKRKFKFINKNKLFYLRFAKNQASKVKFLSKKQL
jgi:ribosomal protein L19